jgi:hypothetical protein
MPKYPTSPVGFLQKKLPAPKKLYLPQTFPYEPASSTDQPARFAPCNRKKAQS